LDGGDTTDGGDGDTSTGGDDSNSGLLGLPSLSEIMGALGQELKGLLIPDREYFVQLATGLKAKFDEKLDFGELENVIDEIKGMENGEEATPEFNITLPSVFGGQTVSIFDMSLYNEYKPYVHGLISAFMWGGFILKKYKQIPTWIEGS